MKKPPKKDKKKKISEIINKIIPNFKPLTTDIVWIPWKVPSREISRHHWYIINKVRIIPKINKLILYKWNHLNKPDTIIIELTEPVKGQGLKSTKWNGWLEWINIKLLNYFSRIQYS
jgi:hypothetical protein